MFFGKGFASVGPVEMASPLKNLMVCTRFTHRHPKPGTSAMFYSVRSYVRGKDGALARVVCVRVAWFLARTKTVEGGARRAMYWLYC